MTTYRTGGIFSILKSQDLIAASRLTTWQPGVTYNGGIPTGRTQFGSTLTPIGQLSTFTGSVTANSSTLTVSGVTGSLAADQLVFDAGLTTCFGLISSGSGASWTFTDNCHMTATSISMVGIGNDRTAITNALAAVSTPNKFVLLSASTFYCGGLAIFFTNDNVTLRGSGQWTGTEITTGSPPPASPTSTIIWKADTVTSPNGLLTLGFSVNSQQWTNSIDFAQDGVKGSKTVTLASAYGGSVGDLVLIDSVGELDANVYFGNRNDLSGYFNGSLSGTSLTVNSIQNGPTGVSAAFTGTLSGTGLTINSVPQGGYMLNLQPGLPANPVGTAIFDQSNNYKGYIISGTYPTFTLSQSNSAFGPGTLVIGGQVPQVNFPIYDSKFSTFYGVISSGTYPNFTMDRSVPTLTNVTLTAGGGSRRAQSRQDRPMSQMMAVAAIDVGNKTVTFETPFHITFSVANQAQISNTSRGFNTGLAAENLTLYAGNGGDGGGNLSMFSCKKSWVKNVQSLYSNGTAIGFYNCYRSEVRECYSHSTSVPNPGGGGYLSGLNNGTADCLFENNIFWAGNKNIVFRGTGGGNVVAYNYMDDPFGAGYPMSPEAGVNAGHFGVPHFELLEGNYSSQHTADSFWGNSIYITVFRNWVTGLRAAANLSYAFQYNFLSTSASTAAASNTLHFSNIDGIYNGLVVSDFNAYNVIPAGTTVTGVTGLNTATVTVTLSNNVTGAGVGSGDNIQFFFSGTLNNYALLQSGTTFPFIDSWGRVMNNIQAHCYNYNICGNVFGYSGQGYKGFATYNQDPAHGGVGYVYENLGPTAPATGSDVEIYSIGPQVDPAQTFWVLNQDATLQRDGNWDWFTNSQRWHGVGGTAGSRQPVPIPDSYYLSGKPAFWDSNPWPWVHPSNGGTDKLPAKTRFEALGVTTPIPPGNQ